jgi:hypothetical protein
MTLRYTISLLFLTTLFTGCVGMPKTLDEMAADPLTKEITFNTRYHGLDMLISEPNPNWFRGNVDKVTGAVDLDFYAVIGYIEHANWTAVRYLSNGQVVEKPLIRAGGYANTDIDCSNQFIPCVYKEHLVLNVDHDMLEDWAENGVTLRYVSRVVEETRDLIVSPGEVRAFLRKLEQATTFVKPSNIASSTTK